MIEKARELIEQLKLEKHPEGGYYSEIFRSEEKIIKGLPERYSGERYICTSIYFLLSGNDFSAFHRLNSDEIWHFYTGAALDIYVIGKNKELTVHTIGNLPAEGESFQVVIKKGQWFAAEVRDKNSFALVGCTVAPGFDFKDFELGKRDVLSDEFPLHKDIIARLTSA
jgi:hypothetical protein